MKVFLYPVITIQADSEADAIDMLMEAIFTARVGEIPGWSSAPLDFKEKRLQQAGPEMLAALDAAVRRITDDHECLDCGSQRPDGRGGTDHDQDCIVHLLEATLAKAVTP
mgnify:CR=1 FL=1